MGSASELASRMDFDLGLQFQDEVRRLYKSLVHHPHHSPDGSFFLLVTFRRHLFHLTEDSVSLALQSCLGGRALDFHVTFLSNNHFRFSVFSKQVGFHVYRLRRVITSTFDLYFHLWNNGTPHWEREKRAWEEEQEKEWTKVLSKRSKREAVKASKPQKRVSFAKNLVDHSPPKHSPQSSICFGAFSAPIKESTNLLFGNTKIQIGGAHNRVLRPDCMQRPPCMQQPGEDYTQRPPCMQRPGEISAAVSEDSLNQRGTMAIFSNSKSAVSGPFCSRCSSLGHISSNCPSRIRCWKCSNWGHTRKHCRSRTRPNWVWQRKFDCTKNFVTNTALHLVWKPKIPKGKEIELNLDSRADPPNPSPNQPVQQGQHAQQGPVQQHPGLQQNQQLDVDNMEVDEADDEWPAWNPAVFAADNGQVLHQHPQFPQDHLDLELSGSSMRFLRGDGTDISLDRVLEGISVEDGSSSSSDASSTLVDRARFAAAQKRCTIILIFNRKDMPDEVFHRASFSQANDNMGPIVIDRAVLQPSLNLSSPTPAITGMEIVTWKPVLPALALQLWPSVVASRRAACAQPRSSVIILPDPRVEQGPATSGSSGFEFQSEQMQPSPCGEAGMRVYQRRRIAMLSLPVASSNTISPVVEGSVSRSTRMNNNMSLPDVSSNPATPLDAGGQYCETQHKT